MRDTGAAVRFRDGDGGVCPVHQGLGGRVDRIGDPLQIESHPGPQNKAARRDLPTEIARHRFLVAIQSP
jgi:hypothetical protein